MSITSDELNFLVYRYLQESGFVHSAFVFAYESLVGRSDLATADIPPGSLINFLQKGLQYVEIEKELEQHSQQGELSNSISLLAGTLSHKKDRDAMDVDANDNIKLSKSDSKSRNENNWFSSADVTELKGHSAEVLTCAWNPKSDILVSGSGDSTARIWTLPRGSSGLPAGVEASENPKILRHTRKNISSKSINEYNEVSKCTANQNNSNIDNATTNNSKVVTPSSEDVTTLNWKPDGEKLATGSYDGVTLVWSKDGELEHTLTGHRGTIFSMKWSQSGKYLASGSVDKSAVVWNPDTGNLIQRFEDHTAPILDLDWKDDSVFATCSTDKLIYIYKVGQDKPFSKLSGHTDDVNSIKWSSNGKLLASCSDDTTAKIWDPESGACLHNLTEHIRDVYQIKWSSTDDVLATASFDTTVKLWDGNTGKCIHTLTEHTKDVYSVDFSPDGKCLASGSSDATLRVWNVKDGKCLKSYRGGGRIYEVYWNSQGDKVAACFGLPSNCVSIIDFRK